MSDVAVAKIAPTVRTAKGEKSRFSISLAGFGAALIGLTSIYMGARLYQLAYGFTKGLDATAPEFSTYWMTFFKIETLTLYGACVLCWIYLFVTR
ncbi:unnamed protein product, partial [marine sediment metagenome]